MFCLYHLPWWREMSSNAIGDHRISTCFACIICGERGGFFGMKVINVVNWGGGRTSFFIISTIGFFFYIPNIIISSSHIHLLTTPIPTPPSLFSPLSSLNQLTFNKTGTSTTSPKPSAPNSHAVTAVSNAKKTNVARKSPPPKLSSSSTFTNRPPSVRTSSSSFNSMVNW